MSTEEKVYRGTVHSIVKGGFGFITLEGEEDKRIFFHFKNVIVPYKKSYQSTGVWDICKDDKVTFVLREGRKGIEAFDVTVFYRGPRRRKLDNDQIVDSVSKLQNKFTNGVVEE